MSKRVQTSEGWARFVRERRGAMSQASLAQQFGVTGSYVSLWEQYGVVPSEDVLSLGATRLGDDPAAWLAAAGYLDPSSPSAWVGNVEPPAYAPVGFRLRGRVVDYGQVVWSERPARWGEAPVEYVVHTDTLHPEFRHGDRLVFRPARAVERGRVAIAAVKAQERMVRYAGGGRGAALVCPANAPDLSHPAELQGARVVGILVELVRRWEV